jgi:hypothetical protein
VRPPPRGFPPPWTIEEYRESCFIIRDHNGQALAYVYFDRRTALTRDERWLGRYATTPHGRLMLTVLGGLAEFERHLILSRTDEGRVRAKARGVKFGRRPKLTKYQRDEARARIAQGETLMAIARSMGVSHMTISRLSG